MISTMYIGVYIFVFPLVSGKCILFASSEILFKVIRAASEQFYLCCTGWSSFKSTDFFDRCFILVSELLVVQQELLWRSRCRSTTI